MAVAGVYIGDAAINICIADYARDPDAIPRLTKPQFISVPRSRGFKGAMHDLVEALELHSNLQAIYVGTFGPLVSIDPKKRGKDGSGYGQLQRINTHTQDWQGEHLYDTLARKLKRDDIWIDVDVHVAARGEILHQFDSEYARHCENTGEAALSPREYLAGQAYAFIEISNGLGCGISQGLSPWRGRLHPEFGHSICRHAAEDKLPSDCHLHPSCLEGRASLRAFKSRLKAAGHELSQVLNDPKSNELEAVKDAFRMQAAYIGQLCVNATTAYSPAKIVKRPRQTRLSPRL